MFQRSKKVLVTATLLATATFSMVPASALEAPKVGALVDAYLKARHADPLFRGATAERDAGLSGAQAAATAYFPQLNISSQQIETENGSNRQSASLIQPIIAVDRYATMMESGPRRRIAEASFEQQSSELAKRLYAAVGNFIRARESIELNRVRINTVEQQLIAARRSLALGQGTVTDQRDAEVKVLQAKAEDHKLRAALAAAEREYKAMVGDAPKGMELASRIAVPQIAAADLDNIATTPALTVAREQERMGELAVVKARAAWLPNINVAVTRTRLSGSNVATNEQTFSGITVTMPLQVGSVMNNAAASAKLRKLREDTLDVERKSKLDLQRLHDLVRAGQAEIETRDAAIEAAQLNVQSTEKSFHGGVRSMVDVLNSIEAVYRLKSDRVQSIVTFGESLLQLRLEAGKEPQQALQEVEALILQ